MKIFIEVPCLVQPQPLPGITTAREEVEQNILLNKFLISEIEILDKDVIYVTHNKKQIKVAMSYDSFKSRLLED